MEGDSPGVTDHQPPYRGHAPQARPEPQPFALALLNQIACPSTYSRRFSHRTCIESAGVVPGGGRTAARSRWSALRPRRIQVRTSEGGRKGKEEGGPGREGGREGQGGPGRAREGETEGQGRREGGRDSEGGCQTGRERIFVSGRRSARVAPDGLLWRAPCGRRMEPGRRAAGGPCGRSRGAFVRT